MTHPCSRTAPATMQGVAHPRQSYALLLLLKMHQLPSKRAITALAPATPPTVVTVGEQACAILSERTFATMTTWMANTGWRACTAVMESMDMSPSLPAPWKDLLPLLPLQRRVDLKGQQPLLHQRRWSARHGDLLSCLLHLSRPHLP